MNAEHTPDTDEVRIKYRASSLEQSGDDAEFDRWLDQVRAETRASVLNRVAELFNGQDDAINMAVAMGGSTYVGMVLRAMADKFGEGAA